MFHSAYNWTVDEIDAVSVDYLLTLMRVKMLAIPGEKLTPIDEVF